MTILAQGSEPTRAPALAAKPLRPAAAAFPWRSNLRKIVEDAVPPAGNGFVTSRAGRLYLDGQPFQFAGLNIYNANNTGGCWYQLGSGPALDQALSQIGPGQNVFRAWFFQRSATTNGQRDWSAFDHTLAVAQAHGERVIATLGNQWGDCEEWPPVYKTEAWYQGGYRSWIDPGTAESYRAWVTDVVSRYRTNRTILAWQLLNEAEDKVSAGGGCSGTAASSLYAFTQDMAGLVKSVDPNHLLSLGTIGTDQCGTVGSAYQYVYSVPGIDLCEFHDYTGAWTALPAALSYRLSQCQALGKPLFNGETGITMSQAGSIGSRASAFRAKFGAQFGAGIVGDLIWDWRDGDQRAYSGFEVGPGDPTLGVLRVF